MFAAVEREKYPSGFPSSSSSFLFLSFKPKLSAKQNALPHNDIRQFSHNVKRMNSQNERLFNSNNDDNSFFRSAEFIAVLVNDHC